MNKLELLEGPSRPYRPVQWLVVYIESLKRAEVYFLDAPPGGKTVTA